MCQVSPRVFTAMQTLNIEALASYPVAEIRQVLPSLVRMSLLAPLDNTQSSMQSRKQILAVLISIEVVNSIVSYLQVNYHELELELKKELIIRQKTPLVDGHISQFGMQSGIALDFERADVARKVHVVLSEIFHMQQQVCEQRAPVYSEILDSDIYLVEVIDILCIALAELPSLLNIIELTDTLLNAPNGFRVICALVANFPDCYRDVVNHIIHGSDEESADRKQRTALLVALSTMNPAQTLTTRAICLETMKVPSFMLKLCLKCPGDMVPFLTGILLGNEQNLRSWFAVYVKNSQKRKGNALLLVRSELLLQVNQTMDIPIMEDEFNVRATALLRLYCALRGIAGLKLNDDEVNAISQLITTRPPSTAASTRFVTMALCMLIACPSLVSTPALENKAVEWLQWLIKEDSFFSKRISATTSLGEILLLLGIHFHSSQISAIGEMVCATLAMKIPIRSNHTNRIRQAFTQDLFTEQVVAAHAVRVPVTINLSSSMTGYLPVHCIHQLLKSRNFVRHKIPINVWIYKQICNSVRPLHPVMPALVEVYVNTLILPNTPTGKISADQMHKPFTETEILHIFQKSALLLNAKNNSTSTTGEDVQCPLTSQLLMLYYVLLYEDIRLANQTSIHGRNAKSYSNEFLSQLPIKYLLLKAEQYHGDYLSLFHLLLRLVVSNYPYLSMIEDWLQGHYVADISESSTNKSDIVRILNHKNLVRAFNEATTKPRLAVRVLKVMLKLHPEDLAPYVKLLLRNLRAALEKSVPCSIKDLYVEVWLKMNAMMPTMFWIMTLNAICGSTELNRQSASKIEQLLEPLQVLRCPKHVFYSPHIMKILLTILKGSVAATKTIICAQSIAKQVQEKGGALSPPDAEYEDLKNTYIAAQESASVHILLEALAMINQNANDRISNFELLEMQGIIGTYVHQVFMSEPLIAKVVHFQTYSREIIPMVVASVPSLHICIDFVQEILNVNEIDKKIFAYELAANLVQNYAIPKSYNIAKLCLNTIYTSISVLVTPVRGPFIRCILSQLVKFVEAFPMLVDDCVNILLLIGRNLKSSNSVGPAALCCLNSNNSAYDDALSNLGLVEETFREIVSVIVDKIGLY